MNYIEYLKTDDWKTKRALKRKKCKSCSICNGTDNLDVHHLNYKDLYSVQQKDLRMLCRRCHFLSHELMKNGTIVFKSTNDNSRFGTLKYQVKKSLGITNTNMFKRNQLIV